MWRATRATTSSGACVPDMSSREATSAHWDMCTWWSQRPGRGPATGGVEDLVVELGCEPLSDVGDDAVDDAQVQWLVGRGGDPRDRDQAGIADQGLNGRHHASIRDRSRHRVGGMPSRFTGDRPDPFAAFRALWSLGAPYDDHSARNAGDGASQRASTSALTSSVSSSGAADTVS